MHPDDDGHSPNGVARRLMRTMGRMGGGVNAAGENAGAVRMFRRAQVARDLAAGGPVRRAVGRGRPSAWPPYKGDYVVGDPSARIAICTLTSPELNAAMATIPGVAIAGSLFTVNLGIEQIIRNVIANPRIRVLLLCGAESAVFHPAQGLKALFADGVDADRRIIGAAGHLPVLAGVSAAAIEAFRAQVRLVDHVGTADPAEVRDDVERLTAELAHAPDTDLPAVPSAALLAEAGAPVEAIVLRPGGRREPLALDPAGYFVIDVDRDQSRISVEHHRPDNTLAHVMSGKSSESILLGLIREGLITQLSHAGYLGGELTKAETALRLGLDYRQDRALRA